MRYYTINTNGGLTIADSVEALSRFYDEILELPEDYEEGKYVVVDGEKEIDVPDYDEEGNPIMIEYEDTETVIDYDEEGNPTGTHEITVIKQKQSTHKETVPAKVLVLNPNWEKEKEEQEKERIANLNLTKADFWIALLDRDITKDMAKEKVNLIPDERLKAKTLIRIDDADHFWRGDPSMDVIAGMFGINSDDLTYLFEYKEFPPIEEI